MAAISIGVKAFLCMGVTMGQFLKQLTSWKKIFLDFSLQVNSYEEALILNTNSFNWQTNHFNTIRCIVGWLGVMIPTLKLNISLLA